MRDITEEFLAPNNFARAWEKVAENKGCAGVDRETIAAFKYRANQNLQELRDAVANGTYQPYPYQQVLIPKTQNSYRALSIPTVRDRIVQQALLNVLAPIIEPLLSPVSFAYRPQVSYISAVEAVAQCRDAGYEWVMDADIVKFFDNIDRQILYQKLRQYIDISGILCLIKNWISGGIVTKEGTIFTERGIPQGAVISPLLANIYLDDFDRKIEQIGDVRLVRYADDFVVMAQSQGEIERAYIEVVRLLEELKLELHDRKTQITTFERGLRFLGHGFLGAAIFPIDDVKPKRSNIQKKTTVAVLSVNAEDTTDENREDVEMLLAQTIVQTSEPSASLLDEDGEEDELEELEPAQYKNWNPHMATLYLLEQGTCLYRDSQRLIVHIPDRDRLEIPMREIDKILIYGNIQISTPVINACLDAEIGIFFLSRSGQYQGHLWSAEKTSLHNELVQFNRHKESEFQLNICREIVRGKLLNSKRLLQRFNRKRKSPEVQKAIAGINADLVASARVDNLDSLRGYEGIGAVRYFGCLNELITNPNFSFNGRNRQPPTDPVNSLLSFGYTLLFNNVLSLILAEGLSPYLGNFHYGEDKKPYLAFDLMEEFRSPIVDSLVIKLLNSATFKPSDFDTVATTGGVYLQPAARRTFFKHFESRINEEVSHPDLQTPVSYRYAIQLQIRRYKRSLLSNIAYESFVRDI